MWGSEVAALENKAANPAFDVVHNDILRSFPELVTDLGGNPNALLDRAGIEASSLSDERARVGYRQMANLLEYAAVELDCPDFGMRLAKLQGGGSVFGTIGVVMKNSRTLGDALDYVSKHSYAHSLAARIQLQHQRTSRNVFVSHDILVDGLPNRCQAIEQVLLLGHLNAMEITAGYARVRKVFFRHQPLSPLGTYRRYFGCDVRFDHQQDGIVFSERDLSCPIVDPDAQALKAITHLIDTKFNRTSQPMHAQVRGVILQFIGTEHCNNERVAAKLHLHPRTLHRRLREEGKSFQEIKDEVRRDLALYYLKRTDFDLVHIAAKLGYAEHSVLTRSCARWFSAAPSRLRTHNHRTARSHH